MQTIKLVMKKTYLIMIAGILVLSIGTIFGFNSEKNQLPMLSYNDEDYAKEWQEIDSLDRKGLPKSALEKVILLYNVAKKDNNPSQVVKTLIYREKYNAFLEEDGRVKAIFNLEKEIEGADSPVKEILQSAVAQVYQTYVDNNYWRFQNRTDTDEFTPEDIRTWSLKKLSNETARLYKESTVNTLTQQIKIQNFIAITGGEKGFADNLRPTLYDLLAHRAVDYFMNERSHLTTPNNPFYIEQNEAFVSTSPFVNYTFKTTDESSKKYQTLLLFQAMARFHLADKEPTALIDVELKRLKFVSSQSISENKNERYDAALAALARKYSTHPSRAEIDYYIAQRHVTKSNEYSKDKPELKWEKKKALEVCEKAIKDFPESYGTGLCSLLKSQILQKNLNLTVEEINNSNTNFPALIRYTNVEKTWYKIVQLDNNKFDDLQHLYDDKIVNYLNKLPSLKTGTLDLPNDGDYMQHSTEFKVDGIKYGTYYIMVSSNEKFDSNNGAVVWIRTTVTDLAYHSINNTSNGNTEYYVTNRKTGHPEAGVNVDYFERTYNAIKRKYVLNKKGTVITDENGYTSIKSGNNNSFLIQLKKGEDFHDFQDYFYNYYYNQPNYNNTYYNHFFLDRAIYRPGQTVYFKALPIMKDGKTKMPNILPNKKMSITFRDANYQDVKTLELTTSEYGTVNGSFQAPESGMLGNMSLYAMLDGKNIGQHNFKVEEYKRPKFEVTFEPIKKGYKLDDNVEVEGLAKAFAGNNIDGAKVSYRVVRNTRYPYWGYWWRPAPSSASQEITNGETTTDENGKFNIEFKAIPDRSLSTKSKPLFTYTVYADVVDITGETRSSSTTVKVGTIALDIDISIAQSINKNALDSFKIYSNNLNGEFEKAIGKISIHKLVSPGILIEKYWKMPTDFMLSKDDYKKAFPNRAYKEEDQVQNWILGKEILNAKFNTENAKSIALDKKNFDYGKYKLVLETADKYGEKITVEKYFDIFDTNNNKSTENTAFFHSLEKRKLEPGEEAIIHIGSGYKDAKVLFQLEHDNKIVGNEWIDISGLEEIKIPIEEAYRGGITYHLNFIHSDRAESVSSTISVPWSNKDLKIEYATFRDKLYPGQEEEWQIKLSGPKGDKVTAEMVAAMYDASLDEFATNNWYMNLYPSHYTRLAMITSHFSVSSSQMRARKWQVESPVSEQRSYRSLNWFDFPVNEYMMNRRQSVRSMARSEYMDDAVGGSPPSPSPKSAPASDSIVMEEAEEASTPYEAVVENPNDTPVSGKDQAEQEQSKRGEGFSDVKVRTNLKETVFFFPNLVTDKDGNIIIKFTMNEALTKWKFLGLAHTKDLKFGKTEKEIVTQKDLMVMPNPPRFFREGDKIEFTAKVSNMTENTVNGIAVLQLFDAITNEPVDALLGNDRAEIPFTAKGGQSAPLTWKLNIPFGKVNAITHRVIAKTKDFSDGEEDALPVLTNRMMVTETMPLPVRGNQTKDFSFTKLKESGSSSSLQHHQMTLEFTSNPAWYAVQSLPYLMEYPYECTEQIFSRYYANSLASSVANSQPNIKKVFDSWKNTDAMKSNLSKNQELKYAILEDTPWVLDAQSEEQQKKNIGLLFDLNRMAKEQSKAIATITDRQLSNGGFSWFPGGRDSWYITQYLVEGMGHLDRLGVKDIREDKKVNQMMVNAVKYCDDRIVEQYDDLAKSVKKGYVKWEDDNLSSMAIHYLYARSYFNDVKMNAKTKKVMDYYIGQSEKYWLGKGMYQEGMIALALHRKDGFDKTTSDITKSLKERSLNNEEMGMYWKYNTGYYWYELPIETHALMIEVFDEVAKDDQAVDDLKVWLLKNKQTNNWKTTKGTAAAVYALLMRGDNWLMQDKDIQITIGGKPLDVASLDKEAGTGYFKTKTKGEDIKPEMGNVTVTNPNSVVAWGAMYWQYFEDLDKITTFEETPLTLKKQLFKETNTPNGPVINPIDGKEINPGDKLKVRIELRVNRDMEYVHMKDMRASGLEPINVLSQYKWQDGLGYYESTRDASTNFFFSRLPKGTYVFEYPLRVQHKGDFSNGITTIQCMYAPEFTSHSEGVRIEVK
ncbi:MAG: hypothetical protein ACI94Y_000355 [Maribacter sp.]|jgi:uncharacterized protein YfaS (alpha-2-macroglobulin family)